MQFIDTHAHLYLPEFSEDVDAVLSRTKEAGVEAVYLPNIDSRSTAAMLALESKAQGYCHAMMGIHPCSVTDNFENELRHAEEWLHKRTFCAIGEIGMDLYWDKSTLHWQIEVFRTQIKWAKELGLPIVIHSREATDRILDLLEEEKEECLTGIMHCFSGSLQQAKRIMELGFCMGIGGVLTYKNAGLVPVIKEVPLEYLVLETDAPYLAPVPYRGKRNESAYIKIIARHLADATGRPIEEVSRITTDNAKKKFDKKPG